jgi:glyoxylase-like metal-dependent hydrolase (beta-lactamase superfamily II)
VTIDPVRLGDLHPHPISDGTFVARPRPESARHRPGRPPPPAGGFHGLSPTARLRPIDRDTTVAPGVTAVPAPGHTPGHLCVMVSSGADRALLLGDAIICPVQLNEPTWPSLGDVDPALADRTREQLWHDLSDGHTLRFGRVLAGTPRQWI